MGLCSSCYLTSFFHTKKTGANWDPFAPGAATNGQQMQQQQPQQQQQQQPQQQQQQQQEDDWGLGELRDEDIWGTLPTKKDVVGFPLKYGVIVL